MDETNVIHFPGDIERLPVMFVDRDSFAWDVMKRVARRPWQAGEVFPVTHEELESLRADAVRVDLLRSAADG